MTAYRDKSLMRCLGEFVGHILNATKSNLHISEVDQKTKEASKGNVTLRRTTVEEIEFPVEEIHCE
ncbi:MAG: hypothetical protein VX436_00315 [Planctomycetota bacterium]|nr:hypothetical protein [Planctomycetota bacterium]